MQSDRLDFEVSAGNAEDGHVFCNSFAWHERGGNRRTWLHDMEVHLSIEARLDEAFMLVTPYDEV